MYKIKINFSKSVTKMVLHRSNDPTRFDDNTTIGDYAFDIGWRIRQATSGFVRNNIAGVAAGLVLCAVAAGYRGIKYADYDQAAFQPVPGSINIATYQDRMQYYADNAVVTTLAGASVDIQEHWKLYALALILAPVVQAGARKIGEIKVR